MQSQTIADRVRERDAELILALCAAPLRVRGDNLVARPWGGRGLCDYKAVAADDPRRSERFGEVFELAADPRDPEAARHPSEVALADGSTLDLPELLELAGAAALGRRSFAAHGPRLPLLPKTLDVAGLLSVQTHPSGNPEVYVVIACEPGASLRLGFREQVDEGELRRLFSTGRADQEALLDLLEPGVDEGALQRDLSAALAKVGDSGDSGEPGEPERHQGLRELARAWSGRLRRPEDEARFEAVSVGLARRYRAVLGMMNTIALAPGQVIFNAHPASMHSEHTPSSEVHALGAPGGASALLLEIRRPGPTYRAWDHLRFPMRELAIERALETMNLEASDPASFLIAPRPLVGRPGVSRAVSCPAFVVDRLRPRSGLDVDAATPGEWSTLHAIAGEVALRGPDGVDWGRLRAGESVLLPAGVRALSLVWIAGEAALIQVFQPPQVDAGLTQNLDRLRGLAPASEGPTQVLAIVNGGDAPAVHARLSALAPAIFRADGHTAIMAHEEARRRGQLLGLLDAHAAFEAGHGPLDPKRVALAIMLPGKGTRASPLTQRLHGIKPLLPVPLRVRGPEGPVWLDGATASLWTWTLVAETLARLGFTGLACKWGDEPQLAAVALGALERDGLDLRGVDAVRFGARSEVSEDLARNKEWLDVDPVSGDLRAQLHRRPRAELLARLGAGQGASGAGVEGPVYAHVHIGSPAFSHCFLRHAHAVFGDVEGWLDVDGYLFEALTQDSREWERARVQDPGLAAVLGQCPDFYARVSELRARIEAERGRPMRVAVLDFGERLYWGDIGQAGRAREVYAALARDDARGQLARSLALLREADGVRRDRFGNWLLGAVGVPQDGRVQESVIVDSSLGPRAWARGAVVVRSRLDAAHLEPGSVAVDCRARGLWLEPRAYAQASIVDLLRVPADFVHTSIPRDPKADAPVLESWFCDTRVDLGSEHNYAQTRWGNPGSLAEKFTQVRQREVQPDRVEARLRALFESGCSGD